jgi:hypothetical protein
MTVSSIIPAWLALLLLSGCGGWSVSKARSALQHTAEAVQAVDDTTSPLHAAAVDRAEQAARNGANRAEFEAIVEPWWRLTMQLDTVRSALRAAELGVDAWERGDAGGRDNWLSAVGCILAALEDLARMLESTEAIDALPQPLRTALDFIGPKARRQCAQPVQTTESPIDPFQEGQDS